MSNRRTLRALLIFLGRLMDDPSKLTLGKLNAQIAMAARIEARGWKYLAGESTESLDDLIALAGEAPASLLRHRKSSGGRREGSLAKNTASKDLLVLADVRNGVTIPKAVRAHYRSGFLAHERRIKKRRAEQRAENRLRLDIDKLLG